MTEAAGRSGVRAQNLSRILGILHTDGPTSRAALTEATGLNRSTIGDLVAELVAAGLVAEGPAAALGRVGRPSPVVAVRADVVVIAANPEIDALTLAAVGLDCSVRVRARIAVDHLLTPIETAALIAAQLARWREQAIRDARVVGVGVAVPGLVRASDGLVRRAPHLRWEDVPLRELVESATSLPVVVSNDANMGATAEHRFGAARGAGDVIYLNGGASGIGGGVIVNGMPLGGADGYAGEFGQNRPGIADVADRRADDGVLEDEVSRARLLAALDLGHADDPTLAAALRGVASDTVREEIARQRRILTTALANAVNVLNPSMIVLGGFLALLAEGDLDAFAAEVRAQAMPPNGEELVVRSAELADDRLLIGAAEAAFGSLLSDPVPEPPSVMSGR